MIHNLTPHPLHIYPPDCPDRIEPGSVEPMFTIAPSGGTARIAELTLGTMFTDCFDEQTPAESFTAVAVEAVEYGAIDGLPPYAGSMDARDRRHWYVVPLVVALAARGRADLLVPYRDVRSMTGSVIGCRQFARPV